MSIELTKDQKSAVGKLREFLKDKDSKQFLLEGYAGTGKTTILQYLLNNIQFLHLDICFSATTNKAVSVMKQMRSMLSDTGNNGNGNGNGNSHFKTIHKLLALKRDIKYDGTIVWNMSESMMKVKKGIRVKNEKLKRFIDYDIIVVDEVSMINEDMYSKINTILKNKDVFTKVIWVGDRAQLPPVNEDMSPVFTMLDDTNYYYMLTEVKRNSHKTIYDFQSVVRGLIKEKKRLNLSPFKSKQDDMFTILKKDENKMLASYFEMLEKNKPSIVLAYSNACVNRYNMIIRNQLRVNRNLKNNNDPYVPGEIILFNNFYLGKKLVFYTSEQAKVTSVVYSCVYVEPFDSYISEQFSSHLSMYSQNLEKTDILKTMKCEEKKDTCPICLDDKISFKKTVCGHLFCKECIHKWLDAHKCCPLCRMVIKDNQIYLSNSDTFNKMLGEFYEFTRGIEIEVYEMEVVPELNITERNQNEYNISDVIYVCKNKKKYDALCREVTNKIKDITSFVFNRLKGSKCVHKLFLSALWKYYYENFVDVFADVNYGYCITTHKSQGSTYENCYVIMSNILTTCPKYKDAVRSLYTSVTRPSKSLTLYY
jgi:hypothetical protein